MIYPTTIPPAPILGDLATPTYPPALPPNHIFEKSVSFSGFLGHIGWSGAGLGAWEPLV